MTKRIVVLPEDQWDALADHPATLQPDDPRSFWVMRVKAGVRTLRAAPPLDDPDLVERVARAIAGQEGTVEFADYTPFRRAGFLTTARTVINAIAEAQQP
jgi:hypothetical protein